MSYIVGLLKTVPIPGCSCFLAYSKVSSNNMPETEIKLRNVKIIFEPFNKGISFHFYILCSVVQ